MPELSARLRQALPTVLGLAIFLAALGVLRSELQAVHWRDVSAGVFGIPGLRVAAAVVLTVLNYLVLAGYDLVALAYVGRRLSRWRVTAVSLVAYAIANNVGFAMLSGASIRYRFYSRWGVTAGELSRVVFSYSVTFWLGLLTLGGLSLALGQAPAGVGAPARGALMALGWLLMLTSTGYVAATAIRTQPLRLWRLQVPLPAPRLAVAQLGISCLDWALAGAVLYVLLPPAPGLSFPLVLGAFLAAQLLGLASHVPGGVGVFEGLMVVLLKPVVPSTALLPALVVYRAVYYLLPLGLALLVLVADETRQRRAQATRLGVALGRLTEQLTPRVVAVCVFIAGLVLLLSGATPAAAGRLARLNRVVPLGLIEVSHFLGSLVGAGLLLLSQSLARRLDAAWLLTTVGVAVGIVASILKGGDYEEATVLGAVWLVLWRARPAFDRRAALLDTPFSGEWAAAVVAALAASMWLGAFAFKHVDYSNDLWWQFELRGEASRFLRASVGASIVVLLFAVSRLLRHAPPDSVVPTDADLEAASAAIAAQRSTMPFLVYLRDKALLFNTARSAFVMYAVQGRTWVALGDPVGPSETRARLIRSFLERSEDYGGIPVFYQVGRDALHLYADFGFTFVKLGEEAIVKLTTFTFEGGHARAHRQALRRLEKEGCTFRIVPAADVPALLPELRRVSDDWLAHKAGAEKGFSMGFFDEAYLSRFPVAVIEREGRLLAFGNLWTGPGGVEMSIDLMRYDRDAPKGIMEMLFVQLIRWGQEHGYQRFALGMAPLSGVEASPVGPLWNRLGAFLYEHGESVYGFQGLRAFKDKFDPDWEPHYLAYPGGIRLPRILADVSALVAGGYRRIFFK
ncbi:MAG: bifunctional lysylphosphatidylglycerol flippase/synthetase MprF [Vicinamibacterales bacterium]